MKKIKLFVSILFCCFCFSAQISAQSFWKKLTKGVENVSKEIDKALTTVPVDSVQGKTLLASTSLIVTPHKLLAVGLQNAELANKEFILEFTITNNGEDINSYDLFGCFGGCSATKAFDNLGNECRVDITFGNSHSIHGGTARNSLPSGIPVKVVAKVSGFSSKATYFTQIKISGSSYSKSSFAADGSFIFKNIPIVKNEMKEVSEIL